MELFTSIQGSEENIQSWVIPFSGHLPRRRAIPANWLLVCSVATPCTRANVLVVARQWPRVITLFSWMRTYMYEQVTQNICAICL
jgi:hypothetical protein